jgi:hypothetical protein
MPVCWCAKVIQALPEGLQKKVRKYESGKFKVKDFVESDFYVPTYARSSR